MPKALLIALFSLVAGGSAAQGRPSTVDLTCSQAADLVRSRGAAGLGTGGLSYDRLVVSSEFCQITETTEPAFAPSRDQPQCFVGYRCKERSQDIKGQDSN